MRSANAAGRGVKGLPRWIVRFCSFFGPELQRSLKPFDRAAVDELLREVVKNTDHAENGSLEQRMVAWLDRVFQGPAVQAPVVDEIV